MIALNRDAMTNLDYVRSGQLFGEVEEQFDELTNGLYYLAHEKPDLTQPTVQLPTEIVKTILDAWDKLTA